jgi:hypothetical protein
MLLFGRGSTGFGRGECCVGERGLLFAAGVAGLGRLTASL